MEVINAIESPLRQFSSGFRLLLPFTMNRVGDDPVYNPEDSDTFRVTIVKPNGETIYKTDFEFPAPYDMEIAVEIDALDLNQVGTYSYQVAKTTGGANVNSDVGSFDVLPSLPLGVTPSAPEAGSSGMVPAYNSTGILVPEFDLADLPLPASISSPQDGDALVYESGAWVNSPLPTPPAGVKFYRMVGFIQVTNDATTGEDVITIDDLPLGSSWQDPKKYLIKGSFKWRAGKDGSNNGGLNISIPSGAFKAGEEWLARNQQANYTIRDFGTIFGFSMDQAVWTGYGKFARAVDFYTGGIEEFVFNFKQATATSDAYSEITDLIITVEDVTDSSIEVFYHGV